MLEDIVRKGRLLDVYGPLLTERQHRCMELYFFMDLSLAEIGEELHISRQGVYDMLHRAGNALEEYERRLHLLERIDTLRTGLSVAVSLLEQGDAVQIEKAKHILHHLDI